MAEGRTKTGLGWETEQHGFKAINYAQTAADVLEEAAGTLVVTPDRRDISRVVPTQGFVRDPYDTTWEDINRGDTYPDDLPEYGAAGIEESFVSRRPEVSPTGGGPPKPRGWRETGGRGGGEVGPTAEGIAAQGPPGVSEAGTEVAEFLKSAAGYTGEMEDRTNAGSRARIDAQRSDIPGTLAATMPQSLGPAGAPIVPENLPQGPVPAAEEWGPGPTGAPPKPPGWRDSPMAGGGPDVMAESAFTGAPPQAQAEEKDFGQNLMEAVALLLEKMKGFSLSPEEFSDLTNMSPDQLRDVYNNLAQQQGRTMYEDPQAWVKMGRSPVVSPEASGIFMGRAPAGGPTVRPGDEAYSKFNIPERQTQHGFMARDYAQAQPGTTDWMRQIYPWARNLPENILQRAIQDGEYLRMLMQKAEAGEMLPLM